MSGDLTNRATAQEFEVARRFVTELLDRCKLTAQRCIVVPGNHDLSWDVPAYRWTPRRQLGAIDPAIHFQQGNGFLVRNDAEYPERFRNFADQFFHWRARSTRRSARSVRRDATLACARRSRSCGSPCGTIRSPETRRSRMTHSSISCAARMFACVCTATCTRTVQT